MCRQNPRKITTVWWRFVIPVISLRSLIENIFHLTHSLRRSDPDPTCAFIFVCFLFSPVRWAPQNAAHHDGGSERYHQEARRQRPACGSRRDRWHHPVHQQQESFVPQSPWKMYINTLDFFKKGHAIKKASLRYYRYIKVYLFALSPL